MEGEAAAKGGSEKKGSGWLVGWLVVWLVRKYVLEKREKDFNRSEDSSARQLASIYVIFCGGEGEQNGKEET